MIPTKSCKYSQINLYIMRPYITSTRDNIFAYKNVHILKIELGVYNIILLYIYTSIYNITLV